MTEEPADDVLKVYVDGTVGSEWDRGINAFDQALDWGDCSASADCPSIAWETVSDAERGDVLQVTMPITVTWQAFSRFNHRCRCLGLR